MLIEIISASQCDEKDIVVEFVTSIGSGKGVWRGSFFKGIGHYHAEFDFEEDLCWGINICEADLKISYIKNENDYTIIQGQLESIDTDGSLAIRLGNSIVLCNAMGVPSLPGMYLKIKTKKISIYDSNI